MLKKIGRKISRLGDVIEQPHLLNVYLRGIPVRMYENLNKRWLLNASIRTVFDVGANTGQFARTIHELLPEAFIYSFEPLSDCCRELQRTMEKAQNFRAFNTALGDREGETMIHRSEWSPSSSLRPMAQLHKENFPLTARTSRESVHIGKLDDYSDQLSIRDNVLVKLDVQGYEDKVIAGGRRLIERARILVVEASMEPLYEGQPLFREIFTLLSTLGFSYKGNLNQASSRIDERVLYCDAVFMREV